MQKVLILFAHPAVNKSRINRTLLQAIENLEGVTVHRLYENYPDFFIDVEVEQKLLRDHDVIIWHHPFYWYSAPAIIKEWMDLVLQHGFAYGTHGRALEGKLALSAISTGGQKKVYCATGSNHFTINQFLVPFEQSALLCRMHYLPPFVIHGSHTLSDADLQKHANEYKTLITMLRDGTYNKTLATGHEYSNTIISSHA